MPYAQLDDGLFAHRKAKRTSDAALGLWVRGLTYAARYLTDGFLDETFVEDFVRGRARQRAAEELVDRGWWEPRGGGYQIKDYLDYNRSRAQVEADREKARERQSRVRDKRRQSTLPWTLESSGVTQ